MGEFVGWVGLWVCDGCLDGPMVACLSLCLLSWLPGVGGWVAGCLCVCVLGWVGVQRCEVTHPRRRIVHRYVVDGDVRPDTSS